ncbi:MAG: flagellar biosynthesis protein FliQ [Eubacteriales bacterium]|nr:flagellar biosynthesis protein FliQ [Eubacteriales bacterium]
MDQAVILQIFKEAITVVIEVSAPVLLIGLAVGLLVSIFQAMTQINEQTLVFIPKILSILLSLLFFGSWMLTRLTEFTLQVFASISTLVE